MARPASQEGAVSLQRLIHRVNRRVVTRLCRTFLVSIADFRTQSHHSLPISFQAKMLACHGYGRMWSARLLIIDALWRRWGQPNCLTDCSDRHAQPIPENAICCPRYRRGERRERSRTEYRLPLQQKIHFFLLSSPRSFRLHRILSRIRTAEPGPEDECQCLAHVKLPEPVDAILECASGVTLYTGMLTRMQIGRYTDMLYFTRFPSLQLLQLLSS